MAKNSKPAPRRQRRGSAWYWRQTDTWYHTPSGTKRRVALLDEQGRPIRGRDNKQAARLALARIRLREGLDAPLETEPTPAKAVSVAEVCSRYISHCEQAAAAGRMHPEYAGGVRRMLNQLCSYCGGLAVGELKRADVRQWVDSVPSWRSPATRRNVLTAVISAFRHAEAELGVRNPLKGLRKPPHRPRLHSMSPQDERLIYANVDRAFRDFLFAAMHTGLRPFCELAKLKAEDVETSPRGMLWRIRSSKTKKLRKIPVRPEVAALVRRLLKLAPPGSGLPLFRNPQGRPWKKPTAVGYFLALKRKLGWDHDEVRKHYSCYSCRHTFAYRMLSGYWNGGAGCSIEVLAELMGNTPSVAFAHYGRAWSRDYQDPLWAAVGEG
jgi:integrase